MPTNNVKRAALGALYCYLWYTSILAGYAVLFCPLFPLLLVSNRLYRYLTDIFFTYWQLYPTALLQMLCKCNFQITGDPIHTGEMSILLMNHRTRTDWNFFWPVLYHSTNGNGKLSHSTKFVLKDEIRHIPGAGWVMQMVCCLYVKRKWKEDKETMQKYINYVSDTNYKHSILLFPEGTDMSQRTKMVSDSYAEKNNKLKYEYVLHPRTSGFVHLTRQLLSNDVLDAVYDVTLIYPDQVPQTEMYLLKGHFPKDIKVHFVRYPRSVLPKTEEALKGFLENRWLDKENTIKEYYSTGNFLHGKRLESQDVISLYIALAFWTLLPYVAVYILISIPWFLNIVLSHTALLIVFSHLFQGFNNFEIALHVWKKKNLS